jgi:hypothetical protein
LRIPENVFPIVIKKRLLFISLSVSGILLFKYLVSRRAEGRVVMVRTGAVHVVENSLQLADIS